MAIKMNRKGIITDRYLAYIDVFSAFHNIKLAPMEKTVLNSFFWQSNGKITTESRKEVAKKLKITSFNLSNSLLKLRRKDLLVAGKNTSTEEETFIKELIPDIEAGNKSFLIACEITS